MNYTAGQRVIIRDTEWTIRRVDILKDEGYELLCDGHSSFVKGKEAIFLTSYEKNITIINPLNTKFIVDQSSAYQKSLLYIESLLKDVTPTDNKIYRASKAAMDNVPYQFDPALQALNQPRQRILMADAVGLGKTLEAGILTTELIKREKGKRILVLAVKSMLTQFQKEFWNRFSIPLTRLDSQGIQRVRRNIPANMNPFFYYDKSIISIDTLKQEALYRSYIEEAYWDIIIIDEAHNVADRNSGSQKSKLAKLISSRCDTLIMLSATPHDGSAKSFSSLLNMLDPTAIANPNSYTKEDFESKGLIIRRFKKDIQAQVEDEFKTRKISTIKAKATLAEEEVFDCISTLTFKTIDKNKRIGSELFRTTLTKSLLSSPQACRESIKNRIKRVKKLEDNYSEDIAILEALDEKLSQVDNLLFSKYQKMIELITKKMKWKKATDDRIVIFTERIKTLEFLKEHLQKDLKLKSHQVATMTGSMNDIDINTIVENFGQEDSKIRLLIATDVASEGINLHYLSHKLIHFDIPWSLMVFQQRNGRVDRYGQEYIPEIYYMQTESENEKFKGDNRILEILMEKDKQASENIGDASAFMNVYSIEAEEKIVADAIGSGKDAQAFEDELNANADNSEFDFFSLLDEVEEKSQTKAQEEIFGETPSLFSDDLSYATHALKYIEEYQHPLDIRYEDDRIELHASKLKDLQYRFKMLPKEVIPQNWHFILSSDLDTINQEIKKSRKNESAWPNIHYLWEQHPLLEWIKDKLLSNFDRLQAPLLRLNTLEENESIYLISGLIPNKKAQPLIYEWVGVHFVDDVFSSILTFSELLEKTQLGNKKFPNRKDEIDISKFTQKLPMAIDKAKMYINEKRVLFDDEISTKLLEQLEALDRLKERHLGQLELDMGQDSKKLEKQREINKIFEDYHYWIKESMEIETQPYIQVIALFVGEKA